MQNLQQINGIGPKVAELLNANGVTDLATLSTTPVQRLKDILTGAGGLMAQKDPSTWPEQATALLNAPATPATPESYADTERNLEAKLEEVRKKAEEERYQKGVKQIKELSDEGGRAQFVEKYAAREIAQMLSATDNGRTMANTKGDVVLVAICQDTSTLDGVLPISPAEIQEVVNEFIQSKIKNRGVVVATSLKEAKAVGQNYTNLQVAITNICRIAMGIVRAKCELVKKESGAVKPDNFDRYMPMLD